MNKALSWGPPGRRRDTLGHNGGENMLTLTAVTGLNEIRVMTAPTKV